MSEQANKIYKQTVRNLINIEREELIEKANEDNCPNFIKERLAEINNNEYQYYKLKVWMTNSCIICGDTYKLDDSFIVIEHSQCNEYDCEITICNKCCNKMVEMFNE